ncbi:MAG TPA: DUF2079 domain-containing protein [Pyrinomonadaceae bacterium]|nr:DUF2079 domain-containing protein [Pyrinomonadaceae bacterium]
MKVPAYILNSIFPRLSRLYVSLKRHAVLWLFVATCAALYSALSILRHLHFNTGLDIAIFDQSIWHYSRFSAPLCTVRLNAAENLLGDHFHPILISLAPLYWIAGRAEVLLIAQAVLIALSIIPIFFFASQRIGRAGAGIIALAYSLFWGIQRTVEFEFHEVAFAVPLIAFAVYFIDIRKRAAYFICFLLLILTKENLTVLVAFFGIYLLSKKLYRDGIIAVALGALSFPLITKAIIPYIAGRQYTYWSYQNFGPGPLSAAKTLILKPGLLFRTLVTPRVKLKTIWLIFSPFLLLSLASPLFILAIPLLLERFLSDKPNFWVDTYHYTATISPVLAMATVDALHRLTSLIKASRARALSIYIACSIILAINLIMLRDMPLWTLTTSDLLHFSQTERAGYDALSLIPAGASVLAQEPIMPHLTQRPYIFRFNPDMDLPDADYIIASRSVASYPYRSFEEIEAYLRRQQERGYAKVFERDGWTVLKSPGPPFNPDAPPSLLVDENTKRAAAFDSVRMTGGPFLVTSDNPLNEDKQARIVLFSTNVQSTLSGQPLDISVQAEDCRGNVRQLEIESTRTLIDSARLTQIVVKLPPEMKGAGEVWLSVKAHGRVSNRAAIEIR